MTIDFLDRVLSLGQAHKYCVDLRLTPLAPAYVRTTTLFADYQLNIEFEQWGWDEGGLYYRVPFKSLAEAVTAIESYLGSPLADWSPIGTADYPPRPVEADTEAGHQQWLDLLKAGGPAVPTGGTFKGSYWLQFLPPQAESGGERDR